MNHWQIKKEHQAKAKEFIPQLRYALQNEDAFLEQRGHTRQNKERPN